MASSSTPDPLGFMDRLSDTVYLYRPSGTTTSSLTTTTAAADAPALVLVCSWMDAQPVHIVKYLAPYRDGLAFPGGARPPAVLLVRSRYAEVFQRTRGAASVQAAVPVLRAFLSDRQDDQQPPPLLVHVFSNGGSIMLSHLYDAMAPEILPRHVTLYDSCPGRFHYATAIATMSVGLARRPLLVRLAVVPVIYAMVLSYWFRILLRRLFDRVRIGLGGAQRDKPADVLDDAWIPHNVAGGANRREERRAYLYSDADELIAETDVEQHAAEARQNGFTVASMVRFTGSGHVTHARTDPARYWQTVRDVWRGKAS